jgi:hypothetical protein
MLNSILMPPARATREGRSRSLLASMAVIFWTALRRAYEAHFAVRVMIRPRRSFDYTDSP